MTTKEGYAAAIIALLSCEPCASRRLDGYIRGTAAHVVRAWSDQLPPTGVSVAAHEKVTRMGVDLRTRHWRDQTAFDPGRKTFASEHHLPVSMILRRCEDAGGDVKAVCQALDAMRVFWILKSEDRKLMDMGFRTVRPENAYVLAGIVLLAEGAA